MTELRARKQVSTDGLPAGAVKGHPPGTETRTGPPPAGGTELLLPASRARHSAGPIGFLRGQNTRISGRCNAEFSTPVIRVADSYKIKVCHHRV